MPFKPHQTQSHTPSEPDTGPDPEARVSAISAQLCKAMLEAAAPKVCLTALAANRPIVVTLLAPTAEWVEQLELFLRDAYPEALVVARDQAVRSGSGGWNSKTLLPFIHSKPVIAVSHDLDCLPKLLRDAADHRVVLSRPGILAVQDVIIGLTTCAPRRLKAADLTGIDAGQLLAALRPAGSAGAMARRIANMASEAQVRVAPPTAPLLGELELPREVAAWAHGVAKALPQRRTEGLQHVLLSGPPGVGKTMLVQSLAATAGLPLVMTNVGQWLMRGRGHLNEVLSAQSDFFAELRRLAPVVGVIDELDSVPNRTQTRGDYDPWWIGLTNGLLTNIDALNGADLPIVLIGISNHADRLDPALVRAGRLGLHLSLPLPGSAEQRLKMLSLHLPGPLKAADLSSLLPYLGHQSQAELHQVAVAAEAKAGADNRVMLLSDLQSVLCPPETRSPGYRRAVALHEAGHVVMARHLGRTVTGVNIVPGSDREGQTLLADKERRSLTRQQLEDDVRILLAGRAADMMLGTGPNSGARDDLSRAAALIHDGLFDLMFYGPPSAWAGPTPVPMDRRRLVDERLAALLEDCVAVLANHRVAIEAVAEALLLHTVLNATELERLLQPFGLGSTNTAHLDEEPQP